MGAAVEHGEPWDAYERISDDPTDEREGVGRQVADTDSAVAARRGHVERHHTENDTSAYKKRPVELTDPVGGYKYTGYRVFRPVWAEALRRLRTGEAKRLMVYDLDRLARDPRDLEDAIEVVEHYVAEIRSATASEIDLFTETGRMNARLLVMIANKASADTARRVKRQKKQRLTEGKPPGSRYRTFGYNVTKRARDGKKPGCGLSTRRRPRSSGRSSSGSPLESRSCR
ncbi:recombinase family protein [Nocardioides ultimimeridianus]